MKNASLTCTLNLKSKDWNWNPRGENGHGYWYSESQPFRIYGRLDGVLWGDWFICMKWDETGEPLNIIEVRGLRVEPDEMV